MAKPDQLELLFDVAPPADPASAAPPGAPPRKTPKAR
ncbi:M48 family peptidase, partial [Bordetella bronchiseptica]